MIKEVLHKINYVIDGTSRRRLVLVFFIILGGALAELVGVSIVLPIINVALNSDEVFGNRFCRIIIFLTGFQEPKQIMITLFFLTILIYVVKNLYLAFMNNTIYRFTISVQRKIAVRLMKAYVSQPYSFFVTRNSATILRSINSDTGNFQQVIINVLQILSNALISLFLIAYLLKTNLIITIFVSVVLALCFLVIYFYVNRRMRRLGKANQVLGGEILQVLQETFQGIKEIKILNRENYFTSKYERKYSNQAETGRKANLYSILPKYLIETVAVSAIMICLIVAVLFQGGYSALVGQLAIFAFAAFKLLPAVNAIYAYFSTVMYHRASIDLVYQDIYEADHLEKIACCERNEAEEWDFLFEKDIRVDKVCFRYEGSEDAVLQGLDFVINKGEAVGLMGKSGGGKTTTVDLILGLLKPTSGRILVDGRDIQSENIGWLSHVGYIPQTIYLADESIRENVAFGVESNEIDENALARAVQEAQLQEFVDSLPGGLDTVIGEGGIRLSGGQRQRIGIARALYNNPDVLILDEATSALDGETEKAVMDAIDHLHGTKTLIIIAHRLSTIRNCDKVFEIKDGEAIERDPKKLN